MNTPVHRTGRVGPFVVVLSAAIGILVGSGCSARHASAQDALVKELRKKISLAEDRFRKAYEHNTKLKEMMGFGEAASFDDVKKAFEKDMQANKQASALPPDQRNYRALLDLSQAEIATLNDMIEDFKKRDTASLAEKFNAERKQLLDERAALQERLAKIQQEFNAERKQLLDERAALQERLAKIQQEFNERIRKSEQEIAKLQTLLAGQKTGPHGAAGPRTTTRKWTDVTGRFSIEAELVEIKDGTASLKKADGKMIRIPLPKLSKADREYIRQTASDQER